MEILFIGIIILFIMQKDRMIDSSKFIKDNEHYFKSLKEDDYDFLIKAKYGESAIPEQLYSLRIRNAMITLVALIFLFLNQLSFLNLMAAIVVSYIVFKSAYSNLRGYYNKHLHEINLQLPYFLKTLEVLAQHYTIPVALAKSIDSAPEIFRAGLRELVDKINSGDSTVDPYMNFAKQYPVADSMRMMRLLYRLGLGSQENKHEQLIMFSKSVSALQNKARETRYKERLGVMENKTLVMLGATGGGVMILLLLSMLQVFAK